MRRAIYVLGSNHFQCQRSAGSRWVAVVNHVRSVVLSAFILLTSFAFAQTGPATPTPSDQLGFTPYQSYHGGDIDSVNLSTGNVTIVAPLISYPQRGTALKWDYSIYGNGKLEQYQEICPPSSSCRWFWGPGNVSSGNNVYGTYVSTNFGASAGAFQTAWEYPNYHNGTNYGYIYKLFTPDGATHVMANLGTLSIRPGTYPDQYTDSSGPFETMDGTGWRLTGSLTNGSTGVLIAPNGARQISGGWEDSNGNQITGSGSNTIDTVGRVFPPVPSVQSPSNSSYVGQCPTGSGLLAISSAVPWTVPSVNGGSATYVFCYVQIKPSIAPPADQSIGLLQSVVLPNNTAWNFEYDSTFGDLAKVVFPTGGSISYTYAQGSSRCDNGSGWVASRTENDGLGNVNTWTYTYAAGPNGPAGFPGLITTVRSPAGDDTVHTFTNFAMCSWYETQTQYYQGHQSGGTLLKTVNTSYTYYSTDNTYPNTVTGVAPTNITTIWPNGKSSQITKGYDGPWSMTSYFAGGGNFTYLKPTSEAEYDYGASSPTRTTNTSYCWLQGSSGCQANYSSYLNNNLLDLVYSTQVMDDTQSPAAQVAYTYNDYDQFSLQSSGITLSSPDGTLPGNLTTVHRWLNLPSATYLNTQHHYYNTGEVYQTTDPSTNTTTYTYDSTGAFPIQIQFPDTTTNGVTTHHIVHATYDLNTGLKVSSTDQNGNLTNYSYDEIWRPLTSSYPDGGQTSFTYADTVPNPTVEQKSYITGSSSTTDEFLEFDGLGREIRSARANGQAAPQNWDQSETCYDADGRKSFVAYPYQDEGISSSSHFCSGAGDSFSYDALNRTTKVLHSDGSSISSSYAGAATSVTDEGNGSMSVQHVSQSDALGRLISVCEVTSATLQSVSNSDGVPAACNQDIGATGFLTSYSYDVLGNLLNVNQGSLPQRVFSYDSLSRLLSSYNPEAGTTKYAYDNNGNVTTRTRPQANQPNGGTNTTQTTYAYDPLNRLLSEQYSDGTTPSVAYVYDQSSAYNVTQTCGPTTGICNPIGHKTSETVTCVTVSGSCNSSGQLLSAGVYSYDPMGRVINNWQCTVQSCPSVGLYQLTYTYDLHGDVTSSTNGVGATFTNSYDIAPHLKQVSSSLSDSNHPATLFSNALYGAFGLTGANFGNGLYETRAYTPRGWVQSIDDGSTSGQQTPGTGAVAINGSERSTCIGCKPAIPGTGSVTISGGPDAYYQSCQVIVKTKVCTNVYDSGTVSATVNGFTASTGYNVGSTDATLASGLASALSSSSSPVTASASGATVYITSKAAGANTDYSLSASSASSDPTHFTPPSFKGTASGSTLTGGANAVQGTTIYDTGTVSIVLDGFTVSTSYGQGSTASSIAASLVTGLNTSGSPVTATQSGTVVNMTSKQAGITSNYAFDVDSSSTQTNYFSGTSFPTQSGTSLTGGGPLNILYSVALNYAPDGEIESANDNINGFWSYSYDAFNRLLTSDDNTTNQTYSYDYDRYGNRWHQNAPQGGNTAMYTFVSPNQTQSFAYDAAGNVTNDTFNNFTYDGENRITGVSSAGATYVYDASGDRIRKTTSAGTVDYLYDLAGRVVAELNTSGVWDRAEVFAGGRHIATYSGGTNGNTYFIHADWQGTERGRSDLAGTLCETITNLPFGDGESINYPNNCATSDMSPLHFTGKQRDPETNLDDFGARYYSSTSGHWMSPDWSANAVAVPYATFSDPQSLNLYGYVGNNPVNRFDPDGHEDPSPQVANGGSASDKTASPQAGAPRDHTVTVTQVSGQNGNPEGHITVKVDNGPEVGFTPKQDLSRTQVVEQVTGIDQKGTPGKVEPRAAGVKTEGQVTIHLTADQAKAAQAVIDDRTKNPGNFHTTERNCTEFGEDVLRGAGIKAPTNDIKPSTLIQDLHTGQSAGTIPQ